MNEIITHAADHVPTKSELVEALEMLDIEIDASSSTIDLPQTLPHAAIETMPEVFYTRGKDWSEYHVGLHRKSLQSGSELQPLLVLQVGETTILVDGHHRLEAYKRTENAPLVPVRYFKGSASEALLEAVRCNAMASIQMDGPQRHNCAWRLVLTHLYSKSQIVRASGVSVGQVGNMRVAARELGENAMEMATWFQARRAWKGKSQVEMTDDERSLWVQQQGERGADGLRKQFGMWFAKKPEIAAIALALYFGRKLPEVYRELRDHLAEEDGNFGSPDDLGFEDIDGVDF